jgi:hypothetical protein
MVRTMGAAVMLLHTFFVTTLLFSTATALILNYTTRVLLLSSPLVFTCFLDYLSLLTID